MFDDYPEFPAFLLRKNQPEPKPQSEFVTMKSDTFAAEADTDTNTDVEAPAPKAKKSKPKPKAKKAKANGKAPAKKAKTAKRAPRTRDPAKLDEYGFRKGTIKSNAAAMYKKGATLAEVREAVGSVQFNLLTELKNNGFDIKQSVVKGVSGARDATKYKIVGKSK
jgi:hypothetical protein